MQVEAATLAASRLARRYGHDYYILRQEPEAPGGRVVVFWWEAPLLGRLRPDGGLTILRVAHPDGSVEELGGSADPAGPLTLAGRETPGERGAAVP